LAIFFVQDYVIHCAIYTKIHKTKAKVMAIITVSIKTKRC